MSFFVFIMLDESENNKVSDIRAPFARGDMSLAETKPRQRRGSNPLNMNYMEKLILKRKRSRTKLLHKESWDTWIIRTLWTSSNFVICYVGDK